MNANDLLKLRHELSVAFAHGTNAKAGAQCPYKMRDKQDKYYAAMRKAWFAGRACVKAAVA